MSPVVPYQDQVLLWILYASMLCLSTPGAINTNKSPFLGPSVDPSALYLSILGPCSQHPVPLFRSTPSPPFLISRRLTHLLFSGNY